MPHEVSDTRFRSFVADAIARLPDRWRQVIDHDVPVVIEPRPTPDMLREQGMEADELLLGLYTGPSLLEQSVELSGVLPATIFLFKQDIEDFSENADDLVEQVRVTLLHELGHHFGLDEDDLAELGYE